jgi:plastocyanin
MVMPVARGLGISVLLLILTAVMGCGGGDGEGNSSTQAGTAPAEKSSAPKEKRTVTAKILEVEREGIPAQAGQWMVDIGVDPGGGLAFTVAKVIAPPGNTNFRLKNSQAVGHDLAIEEIGAGSAKTPVIQEDSAWVRVSLLEGKSFAFYCSVPGHREAGMEGTIKVDPRLEAKDLKPF